MTTASVPTREDVSRAFSQLSSVLHAALRPLPTQTGDGPYLQLEKPDRSLLEQLKALNIENAATIKDVVTHLGGRPTDDKTYIMERVIRLAAQLPLASSAGKGVTDSFLTQLWNDLKHPPSSYLGEDFVCELLRSLKTRIGVIWRWSQSQGVRLRRTSGHTKAQKPTKRMRHNL